MFDYRTSRPQAGLAECLSHAGHRQDRILYVAYHAQPSVLELLSVPAGYITWWIIRDGLARELLRPVTTWDEPGVRSFLTINSHGQALSVSPSAEVSSLTTLPQGARATAVAQYTRVIGEIHAQGLVISEIAIGTVAASYAARIGAWPWGLLLFHLCTRVKGMQLAPVPCRDSSPAATSWFPATTTEPTIMRVWSYTGSRPIDLPFSATPDPAWMARQIASTGRGLPPHGDFVWTNPRIVQGVAHLLHLPPRAVPPFSFWLIHFRGRATVIAANGATLDWPYLGGQAAENFGGSWFTQGHFGILLGGQLIHYNSQIAAPPHGAILHLTRLSLQPRSTHSPWETHNEPEFVPSFDYDICLSPTGETPFSGTGAPHSAQPDVTATHEVAAPVCVGADLSLGQSLSRQIEEVCHHLTVLTTRLESAGVLPEGDWGEQEPEETIVDAPNGGAVQPSSRSFTPTLAAGLHAGICLLGAMRGNAPLWVYSLCWHGLVPVVLVIGDDVDGRDGPSEPSSPELPEDFTAPTPAVAANEGEEGLVVRASDDPLASTGVPGQERIDTAQPLFDTSLVPMYQQRIALALQGQVHVGLDVPPFLPAGCPIVVHNPFTPQTQCRLISRVYGTAPAFLHALGDYADRRGWQQLVAVQPQPTLEAVHLIPAAFDINQAAVVLRFPQNLHSGCLPRALSPDQSGRVHVHGQRGRIISPYHTRRNPRGTTFLRDGDCLLVSTGPFGPPPPQPARSIATRMPLFGVALSVCFTVGRWPTPNLWVAVISIHLAHMFSALSMYSPEPPGKPIYQLGRFPWRQDATTRDARTFCDRRMCRYQLLCPWTGQHGLRSHETVFPLNQVWQRYQGDNPGWSQQQFFPVWPGPRHDRLTIIPWPPNPATVCVVFRIELEQWAVLLPDIITLEQLRAVFRQRTCSEILHLRLPPALLAAMTLAAERPLHLRTGDVIEGLYERSERVPQSVADVALLRDYTPWARRIRLLGHVLLRLWSPDWNRPIITWLLPDTEWCPEALTFTGDFQHAYPGRWVPIPWGPSQVVQLMQVSDSALRAHVLWEHHDGTRAVALASPISLNEISHELHTMPSALSIPGLAETDRRCQCVLRDGDIVHDHLLMPSASPLYGWPDDDGVAADLQDLASGVLAGLIRRSRPLFALLLAISLPADATRFYSRSRSPEDRHTTRGGDSPRLGRWQPDRDRPLAEVVSYTRLDYRILCPLRGWNHPAHCVQSTATETLHHLVRAFCLDWVTGYVLLAGPEEPGPALLLPAGLRSLATLVVYQPGAVYACLLPRRASVRLLIEYFRRGQPNGAFCLRAPPALSAYASQWDRPLALRDGDSFELYRDYTHRSYRPGQAIPSVPFCRLPHLGMWHLPFQLEQGGQVLLWDPEATPTAAWSPQQLQAGDIWQPQWCQFRQPRALPSDIRWVPTAWLDDQQCYFVPRSPPGTACVCSATPLALTDIHAYTCLSLWIRRVHPEAGDFAPTFKAGRPSLVFGTVTC